MHLPKASYGSSGADRLSYTLPMADTSCFHLDLDRSQFSHDVIYRESMKTGFYEKNISILFNAVLEKGDWFLDVGAHIGYFSMLAARLVGNQGRIFSFEPMEANRKFFESNVSLNGFDNVTLVPHGVGNQTGQARFFVNRDNDGGHALWDVGEHPFNVRSKADPCPVTIPITTLDAFFASSDLSRLKAIKIDTEGNEFNVLKGAEKILQTHRIRCIVWELNKFGLMQMGHSEVGLREFMYNLGYETLAFIDGRLQIIEKDQHVQSDSIINQIFMPMEYVRQATP
jgi:FkbM family methyltransferase